MNARRYSRMICTKFESKNPTLHYLPYLLRYRRYLFHVINTAKCIIRFTKRFTLFIYKKREVHLFRKWFATFSSFALSFFCLFICFLFFSYFFYIFLHWSPLFNACLTLRSCSSFLVLVFFSNINSVLICFLNAFL